MVPAVSDRIPRVPPYSGTPLLTPKLPVRECHPLCPAFPDRSGSLLFPFRSPLLRKSIFLSFPPGTEMFQFPGFAHLIGVTGLQPAGLPHSDTCGSIHACRSPHIFAACRVLLRRRKPRHPPSATFVFACEIVLLRPISLLRFLYLVRLSLNIVNDLSPRGVFIPFFLKRAAKIRTFSLPPNFSAIFFHFFSKNFLAFLLMR